MALAAILLGIGGQFANNGGNVLIPMLFSDPATGSNFGNTFFGLGAFLLPLVAGRLLERMELQKALTIIAVIILIPLIFPLFATLPTKEASFSGELAMNLQTGLQLAHYPVLLHRSGNLHGNLDHLLCQGR